VRPRYVNFLTNAASSASGIFIPLYAKALGSTADQIGFIVAAFNGSVLVSSFLFGRAADVQGSRRILRAGLLLSAVVAITQALAFDSATLGVSRALLGFCTGMYPAALLAYAKSADRLMGKFASYGSLGWGLGNLLAGAVSMFHPGVYWQVFAISSGAWFLAFFFVAGEAFTGSGGLRIPLFPRAILRRNFPVYSAMFIRHAGANMVWVVFPLFLQEIRGFSEFEIGLLYAFNPLVQFAVMQSIDRFPSAPLVVGGLLGSSITFLLFTIAADFWSVLATQGLIGASWATLYVGSLKFITERNPETGTAGGIFNSVMSTSSIVGPVIGGFLALSSYTTPMYVASGLATLSLLFYAFEVRRGPAADRRA